LDPEELYPPSKVARRIVDPVKEREEYQKWRKRAGDWVRYHCKEPDGRKGSFNAWLGATWQEFLDPADRHRAEKSRAKIAHAKKRRGFKKIMAAAMVTVAAAAVIIAAIVGMPERTGTPDDVIDFTPTMFPETATSTDISPLENILRGETASEERVPAFAGQDVPDGMSTQEFARFMRQEHRSWHLQTFSHDAFISQIRTEREPEAPMVIARVASYPFLLTRSNIAMTPL
jgi:hypothetical protein